MDQAASAFNLAFAPSSIMWSLEQVAAHNSAKSCYVIIAGNVYDVTEFLAEHPGGQAIILKYAGRDATSVYEPIHPPTALNEYLPKSKHLGPVDAQAAQGLADQRNARKKTKDELRVEKAMKERPPLEHILNLADMEQVARRVLSHKALSYYASATDDTVTYAENARAFSRFFFNARVMRPVSQCDPSTTILGYKSSIPVFVSGAALARLGHPLGEINITRGAFVGSIIQMVSSNSSCSFEEIMAAADPSQTLFFQMYKSADDKAAEQRVRNCEKLGFKAVFLTVDAVVYSNRELDVKSSWVLDEMETNVSKYYVEGSKEGEASMSGTAGALIANDDRDMTWEKTIPWLRKTTSLSIVVKGIQCVEDAVLAAEAGVDGILISNHGGRQLDFSMPSMEVLYKLRQQRPDVFDKVEVYIDGGAQRGTDIIKALCLGARAVGMGRPFLYAQSAYGDVGVTKIIQILQREILTGMRLLGAASVKDLKPDLIERVDWQPLMRPRL
ncbi:FMN-dependent dehydrogenase-domain-containing protein [Mycena floridula]|nr:FMN-dependent dehydrogenase-domain-containing protein [Mycena floridula]